MELKQLAPWNWFKKEQETRNSVPVRRQNASNGHVPRQSSSLEHLFDEFWRNFSPLMPAAPEFPMLTAANAWLRPSVDIAASESAYSITVELPGVDDQDVNVEVHGDTLTISGRKENVKEERNAQYYCMERSYGSFQRQLTLPDDADADSITPSVKRGVLSVTGPRNPADRNGARRIAVRAA